MVSKICFFSFGAHVVITQKCRKYPFNRGVALWVAGRRPADPALPYGIFLKTYVVDFSLRALVLVNVGSAG